jgi:hypothetical protein
MCVFERQQRSWGRRLGLALGTLALLAATVIVAHGQTITPLLRVLDVKRSTMQQEVSRLAADNFDIALARLDPGLLIAHRSREAGPRTYLRGRPSDVSLCQAPRAWIPPAAAVPQPRRQAVLRGLREARG